MRSQAPAWSRIRAFEHCGGHCRQKTPIQPPSWSSTSEPVAPNTFRLASDNVRVGIATR